MSDQCLIVGAGPVGLMMANLLTKYGVSYRIIDQNPEPVIQTKAAALWAKTMEAMHHVGLSQHFLEISHRAYVAHIFQGGQERVNLDLSKVESFYNFITLIPQHVTEHTLSQSLERQGIHVERGQRLIKLEGNMATTEAVDGGATHTEEYRYIFGCDGAHSKVRKEIGATFEGDVLPGAWLVGDMLAEAPELAKDEVSIFMGAEGPIAFFALGEDRYRVVLSAPEPLNPVPIEAFEGPMTTRVPFPIKVSDGQHLAAFVIHERQADKYRHGNAFLLGDAAHIHSPAGGQGVNTGMQDAFNLAWKVAQVIHWGSPDALLDTYHQERHPVARRVLEASSFAIKMASITTNPIARKVQSAAMSLVGNLEAAQAKIRSALSEMNIHYHEGPLSSYKGSKTLTPGDRMPEVFWRDYDHANQRLYDLFTGFHWTLISRDKPANLAEIPADRLRQVVISRLGQTTESHFSDPAQKVAEACGLEPGGHVLVRPDGYLAGYFGAGDEEAIRGYWARHCGAGEMASA